MASFAMLGIIFFSLFVISIIIIVFASIYLGKGGKPVSTLVPERPQLQPESEPKSQPTLQPEMPKRVEWVELGKDEQSEYINKAIRELYQSQLQGVV